MVRILIISVCCAVFFMLHSCQTDMMVGQENIILPTKYGRESFIYGNGWNLGFGLRKIAPLGLETALICRLSQYNYKNVNALGSKLGFEVSAGYPISTPDDISRQQQLYMRIGSAHGYVGGLIYESTQVALGYRAHFNALPLLGAPGQVVSGILLEYQIGLARMKPNRYIYIDSGKRTTRTQSIQVGYIGAIY